MCGSSGFHEDILMMPCAGWYGPHPPKSTRSLPALTDLSRMCLNSSPTTCSNGAERSTLQLNGPHSWPNMRPRATPCMTHRIRTSWRARPRHTNSFPCPPVLWYVTTTAVLVIPSRTCLVGHILSGQSDCQFTLRVSFCVCVCVCVCVYVCFP
jgi:hypothetical protein